MDRIKFIQILIYLAMVIVVIRLFYWQFLSSIATDSTGGLKDIKIPAPRGEIITNDNFTIVTNQEAFLLYAKPNDIDKKPEDIAANLAPLLISEKFSTTSAEVSDDQKKQKEDEIKNKEEEIKSKL